eukprot:8247549-Alexandrium_andersonii.AAC.1
MSHVPELVAEALREELLGIAGKVRHEGAQGSRPEYRPTRSCDARRRFEANRSWNSRLRRCAK